jgi:cbb3-type cytochrome oxidase subunit 3
VVSFTVFVIIVAWAWSDASRRNFAEAAQLPFLDDGEDGAAQEDGK